VIIGSLSYYFNIDRVALSDLIYGELVSVITFIFIGTFFSRSKSKLEAEKFEALDSFGSMVAHELRTPLSAIRNGVEGIKTYLPDLLNAYKKAREANLAVEHIRKDQLVSLEECINHLESESSLANITINMLLTNVRQSKLAPTEITAFSAAALIEQTLIRYPLQPEQRALIHVNNEQDFMIRGDQELLIHVIFNLLKNALYFLEAAQKGEITIWFDIDEKFNRIHFKDTGQGIAPSDLPHIFDRFYTRRYHGTGIGLAFCKTVMKLHKGDIICQSVLGEYADFIISFPKIEQEQK
jgi:signal transduction histidine kinase